MSKRTINIGVIGYGYWGPNLVRNFVSLDESTVAIVADRDPEKLANLSKLLPSVRVTQDAAELITSPEVEAVAIAKPVSSP